MNTLIITTFFVVVVIILVAICEPAAILLLSIVSANSIDDTTPDVEFTQYYLKRDKKKWNVRGTKLTHWMRKKEREKKTNSLLKNFASYRNRL